MSSFPLTLTTHSFHQTNEEKQLLPCLKLPKANLYLAPEVFQHILSYLPPKDLEAAAGVNWDWQVVATDFARRREFCLTKAFIKCLIENLGENHAYEQEELRVILKGTPPSDPRNPKHPDHVFMLGFFKESPFREGAITIRESTHLSKLESSIITLREHVLNTTQTTDTQSLNILEEMTQKEKRPLHFERLFELIKIYQEINIAHSTPLSVRGKTLYEIAQKLTQLGHKVKAEKVTANACQVAIRQMQAIIGQKV